MVFPNGLKRICDICGYMVFAVIIASFFGIGSYELIMTLPVLASVAFLSAFLGSRGWLKYVSMIPLFLVFLMIPLTLTNLAIFIPTFFYFAWAISQPEEDIIGLDYGRIFEKFLILFIVILIIWFVVIDMALSGPQFPTDALWFGAAFLMLSIIFMRMVRHDEFIINQYRFRLINMVPVIGIILVIFLLTNRIFLQILAVVGRLLSYLISAIAFVLHLPFHYITLFVHLLRGYEEDPWWLNSPIFRNLGLGLLIICVLYVAGRHMKGKPVDNPFKKRWLMWMFKLFEDKDDILEDVYDEDDLKEEVIALEDDDEDQQAKRHRENQIRELYRDFLYFVKTKKVDTSQYLTSKEIEEQVMIRFNAAKSSRALRKEYIKVRYNGSEFTKDDVKKMKKLLKSVKKEIDPSSLHEKYMVTTNLVTDLIETYANEFKPPVFKDE